MPKKDKTTRELFTNAIPKMPEGYYSGDKPNPNLRAFIEQHLREKPYEPEKDDYDVPAFAIQIEATKATAIYNMHSYHQGKKPHDAIRQYIQHYTKIGDLTLDTFSGSGSTALAALIDGRKAIAIDRSPAATFITKNYCTPIETNLLLAAFEQVKQKFCQELAWLYGTCCERCGGRAVTNYTLYSQVFRCPRCLEKVPLFDCLDVEVQKNDKKPKKITVCPHCNQKGQNEEISTRSERFGAIPVRVGYTCENGCTPAEGERCHNDSDAKKREFFVKHDLSKLKEIDAMQIPHWFPRQKMMNVEDDSVPWGAEWRQGRNFRSVAELFSKRNLWALAAVRSAANELENVDLRDCVQFALTAIILAMSRMQGYVEDPRFPNQLMRGTYYLPQISREYNVIEWLAGKINNLVSGYRKISDLISTSRPIIISTQSATDLASIPADSIDYIFTDPPYSDTVQYGELNFIWEAWLNCDTHWHADEIIVNGVRNKSEEDWAAMMKQAMDECFRVLKPGRWLSLCYHDTSEGTWAIVQNVMKDVGFLVDDSSEAMSIDTDQKSYNQRTADKVTKRDLVINFRKPKPGEQRSAVHFTGVEDQQTFREKAQAVIREFLQANPGATKDRIYDQVVSRLVRRGQMEAHNFDELLRQVADEVKEEVKKNLFEKEEPDLLGSHQISRWHLKETEAGADETEQATTDSAGSRIHEFLAKITTTKLAASETKLAELQDDIADRRARLQAVNQNESNDSRGRLVREIRELTEQLEKLNAQRFEWKQQALDYSQIFEFYVTAVNPKPKARLEEILEDYCYQTDEGNWRPPLTEAENKEKSSARHNAVRRMIQRLCKMLEAGEEIPNNFRPATPTLAEWVRHCRRAGLHAQGRLLYERGGLDTAELSEQAQADVEEDYQVCVKHLKRAEKQSLL